jgi:predicted patatin/cPLA2 family phospholipase
MNYKTNIFPSIFIWRQNFLKYLRNKIENLKNQYSSYKEIEEYLNGEYKSHHIEIICNETTLDVKHTDPDVLKTIVGYN